MSVHGMTTIPIATSPICLSLECLLQAKLLRPEGAPRVHAHQARVHPQPSIQPRAYSKPQLSALCSPPWTPPSPSEALRSEH